MRRKVPPGAFGCYRSAHGNDDGEHEDDDADAGLHGGRHDPPQECAPAGPYGGPGSAAGGQLQEEGSDEGAEHRSEDAAEQREREADQGADRAADDRAEGGAAPSTVLASVSSSQQKLGYLRQQ